jgi:hypothetical protein
MKPNWRSTSILALGLLLFSVNAGFSAPAKGLGPWQSAKVGDYMTLMVPGTLTGTSVDLPEKVRAVVDSMVTYSLGSDDSSPYQCLVTNCIYHKGIMGSVEGSATGAMNNMKSQPGTKDFQYTQKYIQRFGMKGIELDGSFSNDGKKAVFESDVFVERNILWMLIVIDATGQKDYSPVTQAIFKSLKITPPKLGED